MIALVHLQRVSAWVFLFGFLFVVHTPLHWMRLPLLLLLVASAVLHAAAGLWIVMTDLFPRRLRLVSSVLVAVVFLAASGTTYRVWAGKTAPGAQPQHQASSSMRCTSCHPKATEGPVYTGDLKGPNVHGTMGCAVCHSKPTAKEACAMCHPRDSHGDVLALSPATPFHTGNGLHFATCTTCHDDKRSPGE